MTNQSVDRVNTVLVAPVQLLLESPVLVTGIGTLTTTAVTLTVTNLSIVILVRLRVTCIQVTLQCEGEVVRQIEISVSNSVHSVTNGIVLVQLVLPNEVTILELITGNNYLTIVIKIRATIVLLVTEVIENILTGIHVVQVNRIDRCNVTAIHEWVGVTT